MININIQEYILYRANTTSQWLNTDTLDSYKVDKNLYNPDSFDYKFNDYGFRCDNFNQESEIPILFLGCSVTEGVGLPIESVWAHQLITKIRNKTSKNIPYWNIGLSASGIDTQARHLYWFTKLHKVKYVFALLPPLHRREYCFESSQLTLWGANPHHRNNIHHVLADESFKFHQSSRSLMIIDSILRQNNTQMYCSMWRFHPETEEDGNFIKINFPNLNFFTNEAESTNRARDSLHFGPNYHTSFTNLFWNNISHHF